MNEPIADDGGPIHAAEVVLPAAELDATVAFFTERLGFRIETVSPADDPAVVVVSRHGLRVRLDRDATDLAPGVLRLRRGRSGAPLLAPNGTRIEVVAAEPHIELPELRPSFVLTRGGDGASWGVGRAGMLYRDLIPDRQGGRVIASHIRIPEGGPVRDWVHWHAIRFQMIYCRAGWVRVVYEDQGPPFVLRAGDGVLQPPRIRHRVLESSPGLEVIEVSSPATHDTFADHDLALPTGALDPERDFGGQRFVRHEAAGAELAPAAGRAGFDARDLGIAGATSGVAGARVLRPNADAAPATTTAPDGELLFGFVLEGEVTLETDAQGVHRLAEGDAFVVPAGEAHVLTGPSGGLELLEVTIPA